METRLISDPDKSRTRRMSVGGTLGECAEVDRANMAGVVNLRDATSGLRERKKQQTRATLIHAAVRLCLDQGYPDTTVEQIAAAADVSSRTFSRYFATKESVYLALLEEFVEAVGTELATIPPEVPPLRALRDSHVAVLGRIRSGGVPGMTPDGIVLMLQVLNSTHELKLAAGEVQSPVVMGLLAERMSVSQTSRQLRLVMSVWSAIIVSGCGDLVRSESGQELGPELMERRIAETFDQFIALNAKGG
jgi:AcrR family transcriptional regulator